MSVVSSIQGLLETPTHVDPLVARGYGVRLVAFVVATLFHFGLMVLGLAAGVTWLAIVNLLSVLWWLATVYFVGFAPIMAITVLAGVLAFVFQPSEPLVTIPAWLLKTVYYFNALGTLLAILLTFEYASRLQRRAEENLKTAQAQLVQSEKMASLGKLVAGVAHELNTPIGAIQSSQQSMHSALGKVKTRVASAEGGLAEDSKLKRFLDVLAEGGGVIGRATAEVDRIVTRLRSFARLDEADRKRVPLSECVDDALAMVEADLAGDDIEVERAYGELPEVLCFPSELNQLFFNLIDNARQAVSRGGRIAIRGERVGDRVHVTIEDDGEGIAHDSLERIFDPGFTTRGVGVGAGLGLSICWQIAERHGGTIDADSTEGEGARFTVELPIEGG
jgi:signal transduction histidine kinase